jgi:16S rRNA (cytosine967-C5)-methyltransferase
MKTHRILAEAAARILEAVLHQGRVLDHTLAAEFQHHPKWGRRDRSFVAETAFEVVRWRRALAFVADDPSIAALCAAQWLRMGHEIPQGWQFHGENPTAMQDREAALPDQPRAIRGSVPDWLDDRCAAELGEACWEAELAALNQRPRVFLRANTLKNERDEARAWLATHGVETDTVPGVPDALILPSGKTLPKALLTEGRVEIQDAGSQLVARWVNPQPGEVIIDSCAGAGGKTLHLGALMQGRGVIHALDADPRRLAELQRRAGRAGLRNVRCATADPAALRQLAGRADRLLIDAPCSGLGTLKRQPDLKWRLNADSLAHIQHTQQQILHHHHALLRPGGRLIYVTCSILPSENREAVTPLLSNPSLELLAEHHVSPATTGFDGFHGMEIGDRRSGIRDKTSGIRDRR